MRRCGLGSQIPDSSPATACEPPMAKQPVAVMVCPHKSELFSKNTFALPRTTWFLWNLDRPNYPKFQPVLSSLFSIHKLGAHHPFTPMSHIVGCMLYIYIYCFITQISLPLARVGLCTPFCWLNCPSCFKHTDIVGYSSLQYPLVTFHFNLSYTHLNYALIMPCFLPLVISHGCIFQLLLVELLLLDQPIYCSKLLNTLDKANIDVEPPPLANLSSGKAYGICVPQIPQFTRVYPRISRKMQRVYPLSPDISR